MKAHRTAEPRKAKEQKPKRDSEEKTRKDMLTMAHN